ncbi:MAG: ABC transporter permease subunit [Firmicutes bacterium]|nr:ABC transporter permease subunit [Bacillota bacterium]
MRQKPWVGLLMSSGPMIVMIVFIGLPIVLAVAYSLGDVLGLNRAIAAVAQHQVIVKHGLTLKVYRDLWANAGIRADIGATLWVTVVAVAVVLVIAYAVSLYLRFNHNRLAKVLSAIYLIPLFIPVVIASYALVTFWNAGGFVDALMAHLGSQGFPGLSYTLTGVVIAQVWVNLPFAILMLSSGLTAVPDSLIEASRDVGSTFLRSIVRIVLPLNILPTVIVLTFTGIGILGSFTIPYLMGPTAPQMLGVATTTYYQAFNEPQQAQALAVLTFVLAAGIGVIYVWANVQANRREGIS